MCVAQPAGSRGTPQVFSAAGASKLKALITPFNDPQANKKMLSLATAQMLCSVATLIHDTYLPVYMSDVLGMSNSKIGNLQAIALFLSKVRYWTIRRCQPYVVPSPLTLRVARPAYPIDIWLGEWNLRRHPVAGADGHLRHLADHHQQANVCRFRLGFHFVRRDRRPLLDHVWQDL